MKSENKLPTEELLEQIEVKEAVIVEKKTQKPSASYTITQLKENTKKLKILNLITEQQEKILTEIHQEITTKYVKEKYGL